MLRYLAKNVWLMLVAELLNGAALYFGAIYYLAMR